MKEIVKLLADMKVRDLNEFEHIVDVLPYAQIVELHISIRAMLRCVKVKRAALGDGTKGA